MRAQESLSNTPAWLVATLTAGVIGYVLIAGWCWYDLGANKFFEHAPPPWRLGMSRPTLYDMSDPSLWPVLNLMQDVRAQFQTFEDEGRGLRAAIAWFGLGLCVIAAAGCITSGVQHACRKRPARSLAWCLAALSFVAVINVGPRLANVALERAIVDAAEKFHDAAIRLRQSHQELVKQNGEHPNVRVHLDGFGRAKLTGADHEGEPYSLASVDGYRGATRLSVWHVPHVAHEGEIRFWLGNSSDVEVIAIGRREKELLAAQSLKLGKPFHRGIGFSLWIGRRL